MLNSVSWRAERRISTSTSRSTKRRTLVNCCDPKSNLTRKVRSAWAHHVELLLMERRRWRPTPRAPTLTLAELLDESELKARSEKKPMTGDSKAGGSLKKRNPKKKKKQLKAGKVISEAIVVISNMVDPSELEDPDERREVEREVRDVLGKHGELEEVDFEDVTGAITVRFVDLREAEAAAIALDGRTYGSRVVHACVKSAQRGNNDDSLKEDGKRTQMQGQESNVENPPARHGKNKRRTKLKREVVRDRSSRMAAQNFQEHRQVRSLRTLVIHNLLDPAELEDDDEFEDVYLETTDNFTKIGQVTELKINREEASVEGIPLGSITVTFAHSDQAAAAFEFYDGRVFGGRNVSCTWSKASNMSMHVIVEGMLDPDELEDPDEFDDVVNEARGFFAAFSQVSDVEIDRETGACSVKCVSSAAAVELTAEISHKRYGGRQLVAYTEQENSFLGDSLVESPDDDAPAVIEPPRSEREVQDGPTNAITELTVALLKRLGSLQERVHIQKPMQEKTLRRLVLGLHEVRRGILQGKIKLLIIGTDIEDAKPLDEKVSEIVSTAKQQEVPVVYPMNRRKLGRVLKKNVRVSCVGVYSADGANDIFRELLSAI